jgi:CHAT domain-containing protein
MIRELVSFLNLVIILKKSSKKHNRTQARTTGNVEHRGTIDINRKLDASPKTHGQTSAESHPYYWASLILIGNGLELDDV